MEVLLPPGMWRLDQFRFDEGIDAGEVYVYDEEGVLEPMSRDDALALARSRDAHLIAEWPADAETGPPSCFIGKVTLPLRWERLPEADGNEPDPRLWFEARCGGRDFLLGGSGHTFPGRMRAWCPQKQVFYSVSLGEMGAMPDETRYFVLGFLSGNEPGPPIDPNDETDAADLEAWRSATARFRRTGYWYGRWGTCRICGCVLLPDTSDDLCHEHRDGAGSGE